MNLAKPGSSLQGSSLQGSEREKQLAWENTKSGHKNPSSLSLHSRDPRHADACTRTHAHVQGDTRVSTHSCMHSCQGTRVATCTHACARIYTALRACLRARAHTGRRDTRTYKYRHTLARTKREAVGQCCVCKACALIFLSPGTLSYKINPTDGPLASGSAGDPGEDFKSKCEVLKFLFIS